MSKIQGIVTESRGAYCDHGGILWFKIDSLPERLFSFRPIIRLDVGEVVRVRIGKGCYGVHGIQILAKGKVKFQAEVNPS